MEYKDCCLIDPPWIYKDSPRALVKQLNYNLWSNNEEETLFVLDNIKCNYLFIWVTSSMIPDVFRAIERNKEFNYKTLLVWNKKTTKGNDFYGLGHHFRQSTEFMLVLSRNKVKPIRSSMRTGFSGVVGKRTTKPRDIERKILEHFKTSCYIFSGDVKDSFNGLDCECVDIVDFSQPLDIN